MQVVLIDLVFLALFSILFYPRLTNVRTAKIVINFTPIVKDFSPKLRTISEKTDKYTTRKCQQMVPFLNQVIGPYVFTIYCVDMSNIFVQTKMADEFHVEPLRGLCCVCGVLIFKNGHEVSSRVGDMSRTFNHLFDVTNTPTQISHTCLRAGKHFLLRGARDTFFHHEDTVDVDTSFQQCEHQETGKRNEKNSISKGRPKSMEYGR